MSSRKLRISLDEEVLSVVEVTSKSCKEYHTTNSELLQHYRALLNISSPLSDEDTIKIRAFQGECETIAKEIAREYEETEANLLELCQRLAELRFTQKMKEEQASTCSAMLGKIRSLPAEILSEIFMRCLPDMPHPTSLTAPLLLCHITSSWRHIALNLPSLWRDLWLPHGCDRKASSTEISLRSLQGPVSFWVERVRNSSLNLYLNSFNWDATTHFFRALGPSSRIIRHLTLYSPRQYPGEGDSPIVLDGVESFNLQLAARLSTAGPFMISMPSMRRVSLDFMSDNLSTFMPWSQITHLNLPGHINIIFISTFRGLLKISPGLKVATVVVRQGPSYDQRIITPVLNEQHSPKDVIAMKHLSILTVDVRGSSDIDDLFQGFAFLALCELKIYGTNGYFAWVPHSPFAMALASLTHVTLSNVTLLIDDLLALLHANRVLISLHLNVHHNDLDSTTLLRLLNNPSPRWVTPRLKDLRMQLYALEAVDSPVLVQAKQLIHSRWSRGAADDVEASISLTFYLCPEFGRVNAQLARRLNEAVRKEMLGVGRPDYVKCIIIEPVHRGFKI